MLTNKQITHAAPQGWTGDYRPRVARAALCSGETGCGEKCSGTRSRFDKIAPTGTDKTSRQVSTLAPVKLARRVFVPRV
jgi:hypothetical protein